MLQAQLDPGAQMVLRGAFLELLALLSSILASFLAVPSGLSFHLLSVPNREAACLFAQGSGGELSLGCCERHALLSTAWVALELESGPFMPEP